jgi:hypothetical protein
MKHRRYLLATAVPVVVAVACAGPALAAATDVSVRVEGTSRTLLPTRTVTAPTTGSITKGGTPSGECPATSAAGALTAATHDNWNGTYSSGLGIEVTDILGTNALYAHGSYWEFFVNDRAASEGVCDTTLKPGEQLLFAQVPAKGKSELPIVVKAPETVKAGKPFDVKTFVYTGKGNATKPVKASLSEMFFSYTKTGVRSVVMSHVVAPGVTRLTLTKPATYSLSASAKGDIRSAVVAVTVTK